MATTLLSSSTVGELKGSRVSTQSTPFSRRESRPLLACCRINAARRPVASFERKAALTSQHCPRSFPPWVTPSGSQKPLPKLTPFALRSEAAEADEEDDFEDDVEDEDVHVAEEEEETDSAPLDNPSPVVDLTGATQASAEQAPELKKEGSDLSTLYSVTMQAAMANNSLVYTHEDGINYARVLPDLMVGSCPQNAEDVDTLRDKEAVGSILCLQQNSDLEWFGMDIDEIVGRTVDRGDIRHVRAEIRDFDPFSLRLELPLAVAKLHKANLEKGTVYVHCTAGLGRAPAVALAYMWWLRDFPKLEDANQVLQAVRRCGPKLFAIRAALCDILTGSPKEPVTVRWRNRGVMPKKVEVAGLDVGWHNRQELERVPNSPFWALTRELPVGTYYYKFIVDGDKWTYSVDSPLTAPDRDNNVNNYVQVPGWSLSAEAQALRKHFMEEDVVLDAGNRALVVERLNTLAESL